MDNMKIYPDITIPQDLGKGSLVLVPTPISNELPLNPYSYEILNTVWNSEDVILLIEEHKAARRRWLKWGLPRDAIEKFVVYNEHNQKSDSQNLASKIKSGKTAFLISDCGLPGFCDPGKHLIRNCHSMNIPVTSLAYDNSVTLALALSGFDHEKFEFKGFLPREKSEKSQTLKHVFSSNQTCVFMDTPYRLKSLLEELDSSYPKSSFFLGADLLKPTQVTKIATARWFLSNIDELKREFIICTSPNN